jgi:hypothetical protein
MVTLDAGRHADAADARQLERRSPNIKAEHCTKEVDLETLDPPDCKTEIAPKRSVCARARGCQAKPIAFVWIVFANCGRRQDRFEFRYGIEHGLNKRVGIRARPGAIVAIGTEFIIIDDMPNFWNESARLSPVDRHNGVRRCVKPAGIRGETIAADRILWANGSRIAANKVSEITEFGTDRLTFSIHGPSTP